MSRLTQALFIYMRRALPYGAYASRIPCHIFGLARPQRRAKSRVRCKLDRPEWAHVHAPLLESCIERGGSALRPPHCPNAIGETRIRCGACCGLRHHACLDDVERLRDEATRQGTCGPFVNESVSQS